MQYNESKKVYIGKSGMEFITEGPEKFVTQARQINQSISHQNGWKDKIQ